MSYLRVLGYENGRPLERVEPEKQAHNSSWEESSVDSFFFSSSLVNSSCPKKLPPFPLSRLRMRGYRRLHCLLYVEVSSSVNLIESRARFSRKYMVQKKRMNFNSGVKFHGNFLTSAFLGAGLSYDLTCSSTAKMCCAHAPCMWTHQKHHGSATVRHACYWSYLSVSVWQASCCLPL